jgi:hypothetical protein
MASVVAPIAVANDASVAPSPASGVVVAPQNCTAWKPFDGYSGLVGQICRTPFANVVDGQTFAGTSIKVKLKHDPSQASPPQASKPHYIHRFEIITDGVVWLPPLEVLTCQMATWITPGNSMSCTVNSRETIDRRVKFQVWREIPEFTSFITTDPVP